MISNLSQREKVLVWATVGALIVAIFFGGFFYFLSSYNDNIAVLQGVQTQISDQEFKTSQGIQAAKRKRYYVETGLTSDVSDAKNQYIAWLQKTLREEIGVSLAGVDPGRNSTLRFESNVVAREMSFTVRPKLTLEELVKFLEAFYSVDTLHRINSIKLTPMTETAGKKRTRSGQLSATIDIQVLSLPDGIERDTFQPKLRDPGITSVAAMKTIVRRDVFGAKNNSPSLKVIKSSSYTSGQTASLRLTANDADKEDTLSINLVESDVKDAKLQLEKDGKKGRLNIPGQPAGKYNFLVRVIDDGLPSKSTDEEIQVTFKDPRKPAPPAPKPPPKPPVKMALETRITGNLKNADGSWSVLIKSRMDGQSYRLGNGESFRLDKQDWKVVDIDSQSATFSVDGKDVVINRGAAFTEGKSVEGVDGSKDDRRINDEPADDLLIEDEPLDGGRIVNEPLDGGRIVDDSSDIGRIDEPIYDEPLDGGRIE